MVMMMVMVIPTTKEKKETNTKGKRAHSEDDSDEEDDDTFKRVRDMDKLDPDAITGRRYEGEESDSDEDEGEEIDSEDDADGADEDSDDDGVGKDGSEDGEQVEDAEQDPMDLAATIMVLPDSFGGSITCIAHPDTYINKIILGNKEEVVTLEHRHRTHRKSIERECGRLRYERCGDYVCSKLTGSGCHSCWFFRWTMRFIRH